jgi:hypothetical protein
LLPWLLSQTRLYKRTLDCFIFNKEIQHFYSFLVNCCCDDNICLNLQKLTNMKSNLHVLDQMAIQWKNDEEQFFLDVDYSCNYIQVDTPVGKRYAWQVQKHDVLASINLEDLFNKYCRTNDHDTFVPWMNMFNQILTESSFAPAELDVGIVYLHAEAKLTDVISGISGNSGWIVSKKLFEILQNFNIGKFQCYKIVVKTKKIVSEEYVYLHFINHADAYVNYPKSIFYKGTGLMNFASREIIMQSFNSAEDIEQLSNQLNINLDKKHFHKRQHIKSKEIFLKENDLDLFKFNHFFFASERFMSVKLAKTLIDENISGLEWMRTSKVK